MKIAPSAMAENDAYRLMTGIVVPRPIAWITTLNEDGGVNLAPFSCFTFIANNPVMLGISIGRKADDQKDTARNIHRTATFVVNMPHASDVENVHLSSEEHPAGVSEVDVLELSLTSSDVIDVPRLAGAQIALECRLENSIEFGRSRTEFVVGVVELIHIKDGLVNDGKIDTVALQPLGRVAGPAYTTVDHVRTFSQLTHRMATPQD